MTFSFTGVRYPPRCPVPGGLLRGPTSPRREEGDNTGNTVENGRHARATTRDLNSNSLLQVEKFLPPTSSNFLFLLDISVITHFSQNDRHQRTSRSNAGRTSNSKSYLPSTTRIAISRRNASNLINQSATCISCSQPAHPRLRS